MSTPIRWISVDDTDADIKYIGDSWFADNGSLDAIGSNGPPFLSTLHGTNSSAASFTFNFSGSGLRVMGTYTGTQNTSTMDWTCFVDGISLGKTLPSTDFNENHRMLCLLNTITDGPHTVTVNATAGENQTFWLDKIQYLPSASVSLENKKIQLDISDPAILYGSGWSGYGTQTYGAQLGCIFYGVAVIWYATEVGGNSTTGTWTIDDNPTKTFSLNGRGAPVLYNEKYFQTPQYSMGSHRLIVTYNGDNSTTPLILSYLVVQNGTSSHSISPSSQAANTTTRSSTNIGAILGGALGGAACILVVVALLYRHRRNSNRDRNQRAIDLSEDTSAFRSYQRGQLPPVVFLPDPNVTHLSSSNLSTGGSQGAAPRLRFQDPSSREEYFLGPRKLQNATGNLAGVAPGENQLHHSRMLSDTYLSNFGGPIGPSGRQDGGLRPVSQPQAVADAPPAYSPVVDY